MFGKEFASAIEAKQVAQQEAERQHWVVEKADKERQAAVIRAEGEAEAAQIVNAALTKSGNGLIEVRRIDTAKEIASSLAKSRNVTYVHVDTCLVLITHAARVLLCVRELTFEPSFVFPCLQVPPKRRIELASQCEP